jgi:CcmD family protein
MIQRPRQIFTLFLCTCVPALGWAQQAVADPPDFLRSIGKLYVVVAVIVVVFLGLAFYLYRLDRRLTEMENQFKDHA